MPDRFDDVVSDPTELLSIPVVQEGDGVVTLRPTGEVDTLTGPGLHTALVDALESGARRIVVDLDGITFLGSSGLAVLLDAADRARAEGGAMALAGGSSSTRRLLEITGLVDALQHHATVDAALAAHTAAGDIPSG